LAEVACPEGINKVEGCNEHAAYLRYAISIVHFKYNVEHINTLFGKIQSFLMHNRWFIYLTLSLKG